MHLSPNFRQWLRRGRFALGLVNLAAFIAFFSLSVNPYGDGGWFDKIVAKLPLVVKTQFLPAVLSLDIAVLAAILVATFLLGRIYCEVLCPLGVAQDVVRKAACVKRLGVRRVCAKLPVTKIQWTVRGVVLAAFIAGGALGIGFWTLDPYAIFCRAAAIIHMPETWHLSAVVANGQLAIQADLLLLAMACPFLAIAVLALFGKGRFWCNWICPVGTIFTLAAKFSIVDSQFEKSCANCRACMNKQKVAAPAPKTPSAQNTPQQQA